MSEKKNKIDKPKYKEYTVATKLAEIYEDYPIFERFIERAAKESKTSTELLNELTGKEYKNQPLTPDHLGDIIEELEGVEL